MIDLVRLLEDMAKSLVENPDAVAVTQEIDGDNITLTLKVAEGDMGMVIGKRGNIARAIRGEEKQLVTHAQMMRVMRLMEACFKSAEENAVVHTRI